MVVGADRIQDALGRHRRQPARPGLQPRRLHSALDAAGAIGDMVITSRAGSREGEEVQLSQITVTVDDLDEVDETADMIKNLLAKVPSQRSTTRSSCPRNCCSRPKCCK